MIETTVRPDGPITVIQEIATVVAASALNTARAQSIVVPVHRKREAVAQAEATLVAIAMITLLPDQPRDDQPTRTAVEPEMGRRRVAEMHHRTVAEMAGRRSGPKDHPTRPVTGAEVGNPVLDRDGEATKRAVKMDGQ
jgi:hypothetical protein